MKIRTTLIFTLPINSTELAEQIIAAGIAIAGAIGIVTKDKEDNADD